MCLSVFFKSIEGLYFCGVFFSFFAKGFILLLFKLLVSIAVSIAIAVTFSVAIKAGTYLYVIDNDVDVFYFFILKLFYQSRKWTDTRVIVTNNIQGNIAIF